MKFLEIFLSVLGIIAIIAAAAFILIFLVDLFISISNRSGGIFFKRNVDKKIEQINIVKNDIKADKVPNRVPYYIDENEKVSVVENNDGNEIDYDKAQKEQMELESQLNEKVEEENNNIVENEISNENNNNETPVEDVDTSIIDIENKLKEDEIAKILEQYEDVIELEDEKEEQLEIVSDLQEEKQGIEEIKDEHIVNSISNDEETDELEKLIAELKNKDEKQEFEDILQDVKEESDEIKENIKSSNNELLEVISQKEEAEKIIAQKDKEIQKLREELAKSKEDKVEAKPIVIVGGATIEELEVRLETLLERKKANAKELKKVRKEYTPLNTIRKTLDGDKKKLRRKEAIVAKQNTLLYGVNNYVDIDDEKAKRLTEEHELLEGLRMSVRHCEEVLENNKERLPVLEQAYNILNENKDAIDKDIAEVEQAISQLKAKN